MVIFRGSDRNLPCPLRSDRDRPARAGHLYADTLPTPAAPLPIFMAAPLHDRSPGAPSPLLSAQEREHASQEGRGTPERYSGSASVVLPRVPQSQSPEVSSVPPLRWCLGHLQEKRSLPTLFGTRKRSDASRRETPSLLSPTAGRRRRFVEGRSRTTSAGGRGRGASRGTRGTRGSARGACPARRRCWRGRNPAQRDPNRRAPA